MSRVLYVEDEVLCRIPTTMTLKNYGYEVTEAWNGREALDILSTDAFDVVVLDLKMPVMGGIEFLREYKSATPVIVLSAWADGDEEELRSERVFARLQKPFAVTDLRDAIERALGHVRR